MKYRLSIDEVGNSDLRAAANPNHRYLNLTGVIMELGYVDATAFPAVDDLKRRYFGSHPDDPEILHRQELVSKKPPFVALRDTATAVTFDTELFHLIRNLVCSAITVVIDQLEHQRRYQVWRRDPYHYCLEMLVERYALWLWKRGARGGCDVRIKRREGGSTPQRLFREGLPGRDGYDPSPPFPPLGGERTVESALMIRGRRNEEAVPLNGLSPLLQLLQRTRRPGGAPS